MNPPPVDAAVEALRAHGLEVAVHGPEDPPGQAELRIGGVPFAFEVAHWLQPRHVTEALLGRLRRAGGPEALIVTEYVSAETGAALRRRGIAYADASGNVWVRSGPVLIFVEGRPPVLVRRPRPAEVLPPASLRVVFALLRRPSDVHLHLRALGAVAGVSHVAAGQALAACEARGWVRRMDRTRRAIVDLDGMLDSWIEGYVSRLGPDLELDRAKWTGVPDAPAWAASVDARDGWGGDLVAGDVGAARMGCDIAGSTASVYVRDWGPEAMRRLRVVPAREGKLVVRRAFAPDLADPEHPGVVDRLLLAGELAAVPDDRLDDTRAELQRRVRRRWSDG